MICRYIALDLTIDVDIILRRLKSVTIMAYDLRTPFNPQVVSISKKGSTIFWAKYTSKYFNQQDYA